MDKQDKNVRKRNSIISMIIYICYDKSASTSIMILIWDKGSLAAVLPLGNKKWKQLEAVGSGWKRMQWCTWHRHGDYTAV